MPDVAFHANEVAAWTGGRWRGRPPAVITGFAIDSREIRPGECFIALIGARADGHDFIDAARANGAACALVRDDRTPATDSTDFPMLAVPDPRRALADIARGHRSRLRGRIVAVTGSSGKTSVKEMIADLLALKGATARTIGNWNNDLGLPLSLLKMRPDDAFGVFEVGMNHPGELDPLCAILRPHISVVTCVGPVHIEFFESEEGIAREKAAVLRALDHEGIAVLPADDKWFGVLKSYVNARLVTVSLKASADYRIEIGAPPRFAVSEWQTGESAVFDAPLPGRHVIANAGLAIAVARQFGIAWGPMAERLRAFRPPHMRWEEIERAGVRFINDAYNANPLSMRAALDAFASISVAGRRWLVLGAMRELGANAREYHRELGRALASGPWAGAILIGEEGAWIREGAKEAGFDSVHMADDATAAARVLNDLIRPGDAVLLKASRGVGLERVLE
jgi:UDP-N-acetylmuramoyl-tripeptide--D-alanyl-D-alanine ligase